MVGMRLITPPRSSGRHHPGAPHPHLPGPTQPRAAGGWPQAGAAPVLRRPDPRGVSPEVCTDTTQRSIYSITPHSTARHSIAHHYRARRSRHSVTVSPLCTSSTLTSSIMCVRVCLCPAGPTRSRISRRPSPTTTEGRGRGGREEGRRARGDCGSRSRRFSIY